MTRVLVVLLAWCAATAQADELSFAHEGVVEAPIEEVWKVFATSEGYKALGPAISPALGRIDRLRRACKVETAATEVRFE